MARRLGLVLASLLLTSCYDVPTPECGFRCGPEGACPDGYTCSSLDGRCHLDGSSPALVCGSAVDAAVPADAAIDAL